jgi:hypothetical protein
VRAICWIVPKKYLLLLDQTIGALFVAALIVHIATSIVLKQLIAQADKTKNQLDDYLHN